MAGPIVEFKLSVARMLGDVTHRATDFRNGKVRALLASKYRIEAQKVAWIDSVEFYAHPRSFFATVH